MKEMFGYCGLDCGKCDAYQATVRNDDELRKKTAELWSELNGYPIRPEDINCLGCKGEGVKTYFCSSLCEVRKCAVEKKIRSCGFCEQMNDCNKLKAFTDNNPDLLNNLKKSMEA